MANENRPNTPASSDWRLTVLTAVTVLAALYWLAQHFGITPFPHSADGFVGGLAMGTGIAALIAWTGTSRV